VWLSMAGRTHRNEVQLGIVSAAAAEMLVMDSRLDMGKATGLTCESHESMLYTCPR